MPSATPQPAGHRVDASFVSQPRRELLPGAYVQVRFDRAVNPTAVLVPRDALSRTAEGAFVRIVNDQDEVEQRSVVAERMMSSQWVVSS